MKKLLEKKYLICRIVATILIVVTAGIFIYASANPVDDFRLHYKYSDFFSERWQNEPDGELISDDYINIAPGETVRLYHTLPYTIAPDEAIAIYDPGIYVAVYANGTFLGDFAKGTTDTIGMEVGNSWFIIGIPMFAHGKELTLELKNTTHKNKRFYFSNAIFGQRNDLNNEIFIKNMSAFLNGFMFIIIGFILVIFTIFLFKYQIESMKKPAAYMAVISLLSGIWFLIDSNLPQFISGSVSIRYLSSFYLLMILPVFQLLFFMEYLNNGKNLIQYMLLTYMAFMAAVVILYVADIVHISIGFFALMSYLFFITVGLMTLEVREFFITESRYLFASVLGTTFLVGVTARSFLRYYLDKGVDNSNSFRIGYSVFLITLTLTVLLKSFHDIRGEMNLRRLKELAYVDTVTGGNSLAYLNEKFSEISSEQRDEYWLLYMNLVGFKAVNEIIGWENGNRLLKELYEKNQLSLEDGESQGAMGQSSFAMLIKSDDKAQNVRRKCSMLREGLEKLLRDKYKSLSVRVEFSACPISAGDDNFKAVLDLARIAYRNSAAAYDLASDCWLYTEMCKDKLRVEKTMENRLEKALLNKEMELFLQPKVDPHTGKVTGAEALVRWRRNDGSVLGPVYFIPVFERNRMIARVDLFMFRETCLFIKKWVDEGNEPFKISVNLSRYSILNADNFESYEQIIREIKPPIELIEFEITESMAYNNESDISEIIDRIHDLGATVSMDDFGSSYSNLVAIQRLQFDTVKIDRGIFTHGFPDNEKSFQMVSALMRMFTTIGISVVAEGIEAENQVQALRKLGCHSIQGYYYSRPLDIAKFKEFFDVTNRNVS